MKTGAFIRRHIQHVLGIPLLKLLRATYFLKGVFALMVLLLLLAVLPQTAKAVDTSSYSWKDIYSMMGITIPASAAADGSGNMYAFDNTNKKLKVLSGITVTSYDLSSQMTGKVLGMGADNAGTVYLAEYIAGSGGIYHIYKCLASNRNSLIDITGGAGFSAPYAVAPDNNGNVYVADTYNHRIMMYNGSSWSQVTTGGFTLNTPRGITVASNGDLYVSNAGSKEILKRSGATWTNINIGNVPNFWWLGQMETDTQGNAYVVDETGTNRVMKYDGSSWSTYCQYADILSVAIDNTSDAMYLAGQGGAYMFRRFGPPMTANATNNSVSASPSTVTANNATTLTATGDRQTVTGVYQNDERYIPLNWTSSESGKSGNFTWNGSNYTSTYTPSTGGTSYTITVNYIKQVYASGSWGASGITDTKTTSLAVMIGVANADANNNTISFSPVPAYLGETVTLSAVGDRQAATGVTVGDTRYIPLSFANTASDGQIMGNFTLSNGSYTANCTFLYIRNPWTVSATFRKQQWDGTAWVNSFPDDTKYVNISLLERAPTLADATKNIATVSATSCKVGDVITINATGDRQSATTAINGDEKYIPLDRTIKHEYDVWWEQFPGLAPYTSTFTVPNTVGDYAIEVAFMKWVYELNGNRWVNTFDIDRKNFTLKVSARPYTVTYNINGGAGTTPTDNSTYLAGASVTAAGKGDLTKTGYDIVGWNTAADGSGTTYAPGASFSMGFGDMTLYALWKAPVSASNNTIALSKSSQVIGTPVTITAYGDNQGSTGTYSGEIRYVPTTWQSTEALKSGSFTLLNSSYTADYTPAAAGTYTITATYKKQTWDGTSWNDATGADDTKQIAFQAKSGYSITVDKTALEAGESANVSSDVPDNKYLMSISVDGSPFQADRYGALRSIDWDDYWEGGNSGNVTLTLRLYNELYTNQTTIDPSYPYIDQATITLGPDPALAHSMTASPTNLNLGSSVTLTGTHSGTDGDGTTLGETRILPVEWYVNDDDWTYGDFTLTNGVYTGSYTPASAGTFDIDVTFEKQVWTEWTDYDGTVYTNWNDVYSFDKIMHIEVTVPAPTVTALSASSGSAAGGEMVTITGTNFIQGTTTVQFGGIKATGVVVNSPTSLTCITLPGTGTVDVTATNLSVTSATSSADQYTFANSPSGSVVTEYDLPSGSLPETIAKGPDGNLWYTDGDNNKICKISTSGIVTQYTVPTANSYPQSITLGPDGNMWFVENIAKKIGKITPSGAITEYSGGYGFDPMYITAGPDGNLWFTEQNDGSSGTSGSMIGRITVNGTKKFFTVPSGAGSLGGITAGPDGNLWFVDIDLGKIGKVTTSGTITEYSTPNGNSSRLWSITSGPDGNLWFTEGRNGKIGMIKTDGTISEYSITSTNANIYYITAGSDGRIWVTESGANKVGAIKTDDHTFTEYAVPTSSSNPYGITAGPDGNIWFAEYNGQKIGRLIVVDPPTVTALSVSSGSAAGGEMVTITGTNFYAGITTVQFGGIKATGIVVNSPTSLTCITLPGTGTVDVTVTNPGGTSPTSSADQYTFTNSPSGSVVTEFDAPAGSEPFDIKKGPDGNLWYTDNGANKICKITTAGVITRYDIPTANSEPEGITLGPDGNMWFVERETNKIGKITTSGVITEYSIPTIYSGTEYITAGPDGNLWFAERNDDKVGRITPNGVITEFVIPTSGSSLIGITAGPDGNLWFTEPDANKIGRITTSGVITEFNVPTSPSDLYGITAGPDGNLWFTEADANKIGMVSTSGVFTEYNIPTSDAGAYFITAGTDGRLWFAEENANKIGAIATNGTFAEYDIPTSNSYPYGITAGPDGNIWFAENGGQKIGKLIVVDPPTVTALSASSGSAAGGEMVTITGTNFYAGLTTVQFGGNKATGVVVNSPTSLTCITLPGTGMVDVTVTNPVGTSPTSSADQYTFTNSPSGSVVTEFDAIPGSTPYDIARGLDGNLWYTDYDGNKVCKISTTGAITEYTIPTAGSYPQSITLGSDGNMWFVECDGNAEKIAKITPSGVITEYPLPGGHRPIAIVAGPDGNMWFTEQNDGTSWGSKIGRITVNGTIAEFVVPSGSERLGGITAGPDGNLWFVDSDMRKISKITPSGTITEYNANYSGLSGIAAGPDGNLWFTDEGNDHICKITTGGVIEEYQIPTSGSGVYVIAAGQDGKMWFTEYNTNKVGAITTNGTFTEYDIPTSDSYPYGITAGPDGNIWFAENSGEKIGRLEPGYTVTYDTNGGTGTTPTDNNSYPSGATVTLDSGSGQTKANYTFGGWSLTQGGSAISGSTITIQANNVTLYAIWNVNDGTITFDSNGGSPVASVTQTFNTTVAAPTTPTKTGYSFGGWYIDSGLTSAASFPYTITADQTLFAKWNINPYTLTFNSNGGSTVAAVVQNYNTAVAMPTTPTKISNTFAGWYSEAGLSNVVVFPYTLTSDITLYAKWTLTPNIDADSNGQVDTNIDSNGDGVADQNLDTNGDGTPDASLVYNTITYNGNGNTSGTAPASTQVLEGFKGTVSATSGSLIKTGNTFGGWNTATNGSGTSYAAGSTITLNGNITLYAKWTANTNIDSDSNGQADTNIDSNGDGTPDQNIDSNADGKPDTQLVYNAITYNGNGNTGGSVPTATQVLKGFKGTVSANSGSLVKTSNTYADWNTQANGSGTSYAGGASLTLTGDITLYAQWTLTPNIDSDGNGQADTNIDSDGNGTPDQNIDSDADGKPDTQLVYNNITYNGNGNTGGSVPTATQVLKGFKGTVSANNGSLVKTGNTFVSWNTQVNGSGTSYTGGASLTLTGDITLYAQWTLTLNVDSDGNGQADTNIDSNGDGVADQNLDTNGDGTPDASLVYNTITYSGNGSTGGNVPVETKVLAGFSVVTGANSGNLTRTGYTFAGWNTSVDGTGTSYAAGASIPLKVANLTLYAQWTIDTENNPITVENLFSPNSDGINDYFQVDHIETLGRVSLKIYDRWGSIVYETTNYQNDWSGISRGNQLPEGSYVYFISTANAGTKTGVVNIVR